MTLHHAMEAGTIPTPMYLALLAAAGATSIALGVYAWRNRRHPGFAFFAVMELATAWWVICYLGEQLDADRARLWFALKFPAIATIPPSWLLFSLHQLGERPRSTIWWLAYVWPVVLGPLVFTNDGHRLFFTEIVQRQELVGLNGPLFSFHIAINYTFFLVAAALLFRDWRLRRRVQTGLLFVGGLVPFVGNVVNELGKAMPGVAAYVAYNPTLPGFAFSSLFVGWAAVRYRLLDPRPMARDALFESMPEVVLVLNEHGIVVDANRAAAEMLQVPERDLLGLPWPEVFPAPDWQGIPHAAEPSVERERLIRGAPRWLEIHRHHLWDRRGRSVGLLMVARDVTTRKRYELELHAASYRDRLTGLSNRRYFDDEAARLLAGREFPVAIFAFDLDGLKAVNDRHGHEAGDRLLVAMAEFLTHFFRAGDRVVRQGGDEFVVLLPATTAEEADRIHGRMGPALAQFNGERTPPLRFSAGLAVAADAADWAAAITRADERLYESKRGTGTVPA